MDTSAFPFNRGFYVEKLSFLHVILVCIFNFLIRKVAINLSDCRKIIKKM
jgi:hypothetical protein